MKVKELRKALEAFDDNEKVVIMALNNYELDYVGITNVESDEIFQYSGLCCVFIPAVFLSY